MNDQDSITLEKLKSALGYGSAAPTSEAALLAAVEALKEQARARPAVGVNWERKAEIAEGWRRQHEPELVALREAAGGNAADVIERLTRDAQIARDSGDRRSDGARNASESRRIRILELETRVRASETQRLQASNEHHADRRRWLDEKHLLEQRITGQRHHLADHERKYAEHGAFRKSWEPIYDELRITKGVFSRSPATVLAMVKGLRERNVSRETSDQGIDISGGVERVITGPHPGIPVYDRGNLVGYASVDPKNGHLLLDAASSVGFAAMMEPKLAGYSIYGPEQAKANQEQRVPPTEEAVRREYQRFTPGQQGYLADQYGERETPPREAERKYLGAIEGQPNLRAYTGGGLAPGVVGFEGHLTAPSQAEGSFGPWSLAADLSRVKEAAVRDLSPARCEHGFHLGPIWQCTLDDHHFGDHQPSSAVVGREALRQVGNYQQALRNTRDEAISGLNAD